MNFTKNWNISWMGKQVFIRLITSKVYNGILKDWDETYVKINNTYFNPDHIVEITFIENPIKNV